MSRWQRAKELATVGVPFYVTRRNADGEIATWSVNAWIALAIIFVVSLNIVLWGTVGLVAALGILL